MENGKWKMGNKEQSNSDKKPVNILLVFFSFHFQVYSVTAFGGFY